MESRSTEDNEGRIWTRSSLCKRCIEISPQGDYVLMRDADTPEVTIKVLSSEFKSFIDGVKQGDFDSLL